MLDRVRLRLAFTAAAVATGAAVAALGGRLEPAVAVATLLTAGHAVSVPAPSGRPVPLTAGILVASLMLLGGDPVALAVGGAVGITGGWWVLAVRHGVRTADEIVLVEAVAAVAFSIVAGTVEAVLGHEEAVASPTHLGVVAVGALAWFLAEAVTRSRMPGQRRRVAARLQWWRAVSDWPVLLTMVSAGSLFAVSLPEMGPWAVVVAGLPYGFADASFRRLRQTRRTYAQTIAAMGRIPEAAGQVPVGRSARGGDLAGAVAAEMGMTARVVDRVTQAAALLEIGRVVLANPGIAGGGYSADDLAAWSAAIVGESERLQPVADLVVGAPRPYRQPGQERDPDVQPPAHVVKVAVSYERHRDDGLPPLDALERLHRGAAYDFDPDVVHALRKVLVRRGALGA